MTPEGRVKAKLKWWLKAAPWSFWPVQTGYGAATVDCFTAVAGRGQLVAIECKREGVTKPTPRQSLEMQKIRRAGGLTFVVTMKDGELVWLEQKDQ